MASGDCGNASKPLLTATEVGACSKPAIVCVPTSQSSVMNVAGAGVFAYHHVAQQSSDSGDMMTGSSSTTGIGSMTRRQSPSSANTSDQTPFDSASGGAIGTTCVMQSGEDHHPKRLRVRDYLRQLRNIVPGGPIQSTEAALAKAVRIIEAMQGKAPMAPRMSRDAGSGQSSELSIPSGEHMTTDSGVGSRATTSEAPPISSEPAEPQCEFLLDVHTHKVMSMSPSLMNLLDVRSEVEMKAVGEVWDLVFFRDVLPLTTQITAARTVVLDMGNSQGSLEGGESTSSFFCIRLRCISPRLESHYQMEETKSYITFCARVSIKIESEDVAAVRLSPLKSYYCSDEYVNRKGAAAPSLTLRHTAELLVCEASLSCAELLGFLPQDIIGTSVFQLYHPEDLPHLASIYQQVTTCQGKPFRSDPYRMRTQNGSYVVVETEWSSFLNPWLKNIEFVISRSIVLKAPEKRDVLAPRFRSSQRNLSAEQQMASVRLQNKIRAILCMPVPSDRSSVNQQNGGNVTPGASIADAPTVGVATDCSSVVGAEAEQRIWVGIDTAGAVITRSSQEFLSPKFAEDYRKVYDELHREHSQPPQDVEDDSPQSAGEAAEVAGRQRYDNSAESNSSSEHGNFPTYAQLNYTETIRRFLTSDPKTYVSEEEGLLYSACSDPAMEKETGDDYMDMAIPVPPVPQSNNSVGEDSIKVLPSDHELIVGRSGRLDTSPAAQAAVRDETGAEVREDTQATDASTAQRAQPLNENRAQHKPDVENEQQTGDADQDMDESPEESSEVCLTSNNLRLHTERMRSQYIRDVLVGNEPLSILRRRCADRNDSYIIHVRSKRVLSSDSSRRSDRRQAKVARYESEALKTIQSSDSSPDDKKNISPASPASLGYSPVNSHLQATTEGVLQGNLPQQSTQLQKQLLAELTSAITAGPAGPTETGMETEAATSTEPIPGPSTSEEVGTLDDRSSDLTHSSMFFSSDASDSETRAAPVVAAAAVTLGLQRRRLLPPPWLQAVMWNENIALRYMMKLKNIKRMLKRDRELVIEQPDLVVQQMTMLRELVASPNYIVPELDTDQLYWTGDPSEPAAGPSSVSMETETETSGTEVSSEGGPGIDCMDLRGVQAHDHGISDFSPNPAVAAQVKLSRIRDKRKRRVQFTVSGNSNLSSSSLSSIDVDSYCSGESLVASAALELSVIPDETKPVPAPRCKVGVDISDGSNSSASSDLTPSDQRSGASNSSSLKESDAGSKSSDSSQPNDKNTCSACAMELRPDTEREGSGELWHICELFTHLQLEKPPKVSDPPWMQALEVSSSQLPAPLQLNYQMEVGSTQATSGSDIPSGDELNIEQGKIPDEVRQQVLEVLAEETDGSLFVDDDPGFEDSFFSFY